MTFIKLIGVIVVLALAIEGIHYSFVLLNQASDVAVFGGAVLGASTIVGGGFLLDLLFHGKGDKA